MSMLKTHLRTTQTQGTDSLWQWTPSVRGSASSEEGAAAEIEQPAAACRRPMDLIGPAAGSR